MARKATKKRKAKKSSMTRRDLFKTAAVGALGAVVASLPTSRAKAQSYRQSAAVLWQQFTLKMALMVPHVFANEHSLGYRKYQRQKIVGKMLLGFSRDGQLVDVQFKDIVNMTHKLSNGKNVTYDVMLDEEGHGFTFNATGSNKTEVFNGASVCMSIVAEPSYNIGELDEDTSLYITLAGKGQLKKGKVLYVRGRVAGTLGCGCSAYGHKSPTRTIGWNGPTSEVVDVASTYGTWFIKLDA